jgi:hypothetical protein
MEEFISSLMTHSEEENVTEDRPEQVAEEPHIRTDSSHVHLKVNYNY